MAKHCHPFYFFALERNVTLEGKVKRLLLREMALLWLLAAVRRLSGDSVRLSGAIVSLQRLWIQEMYLLSGLTFKTPK